MGLFIGVREHIIARFAVESAGYGSLDKSPFVVPEEGLGVDGMPARRARIQQSVSSVAKADTSYLEYFLIEGSDSANPAPVVVVSGSVALLDLDRGDGHIVPALAAVVASEAKISSPEDLFAFLALLAGAGVHAAYGEVFQPVECLKIFEVFHVKGDHRYFVCSVEFDRALLGRVGHDDFDGYSRLALSVAKEDVGSDLAEGLFDFQPSDDLDQISLVEI